MKKVNHCLISTNLRLYNRDSVIARNLAVLTSLLLLFIPSLLYTQYSPLVARFTIAMLTRQYTSSKQSMGPRTRRIFVDFAKIYFFISSVLQIRTVSVFLYFLPKFSQAKRNFKSAVVLPWSRKNFCQTSKLANFSSCRRRYSG